MPSGSITTVAENYSNSSQSSALGQRSYTSVNTGGHTDELLQRPAPYPAASARVPQPATLLVRIVDFRAIAGVVSLRIPPLPLRHHGDILMREFAAGRFLTLLIKLGCVSQAAVRHYDLHSSKKHDTLLTVWRWAHYGEPLK